MTSKQFDSYDDLKGSVEKWFTCQRASMQNLSSFTSVLVWVVLMSKSRLRYVEFDNNE